MSDEESIGIKICEESLIQLFLEISIINWSHEYEKKKKKF